MINRFKRTGVWIAITASGALILGGVAAFLSASHRFSELPEMASRILSPPQPEATADAALALADIVPAERANDLSRLANGKPSLIRNRARYLLAVDNIENHRGGRAIALLESLDGTYPELAPYVLLKLGQAQAAAGQQEAAEATWKRLLQTHGEDVAAASALYQLGRSAPERLDELVKRFPAYPGSVEIAKQRLAQDPHRSDTLPLLLQIAKYGLHHSDVESVLDRLSQEFADELAPEHWQTIGFGYWELGRYGKAAPAYARAPESPRNLYRAGRGHQIDLKRTEAIAIYTRLDQAFPEADETATGLLRLSDIVSLEAAVGVLDQVINRFPDRAAEALEKKAEVLLALNDFEGAQAAREILLNQYRDSETAAELRMKWALEYAEAGDVRMALNWGKEVLKHTPQADIAADAGFWSGKWSRQLGQAEAAQNILEQVITNHPESYYAWRAAVALGWPVGDFRTVRFDIPQVQLPPQRHPLPAGSAVLSELYQLGQDKDAWRRWQIEFKTLQDPTVTEQFTDGLMRLGVGDNLDGIYMVSSLAWRDHPDDKAQYQALRRSSDYWRALYPFPFADAISDWATQRQLNPLLVTALIRQESRFEPKIRSVVGATGLMQVMPSTASWIQLQTGIPNYDLENPIDNLNLGTWYLDYTHEEYNNHSLFAVASYNAGPGNVAEWIERGGYGDADEFVERIPFPETEDYVRAVFGGYWNYLRLYNPTIAAKIDRRQVRTAKSVPLFPLE